MKNLAKNVLLTSVLALTVQAGAHAFDGAVLKSIKIDRAPDRDYVITIKTDKDVSVKKFINSNDELVLDLKNVRPAQFVNTLYNSSTAIENVIVQPISGDRVKVFLTGTNISTGKVILDTRNEALSSLPLTQPAPEPAIAKPLAEKKVSAPVSEAKTVPTAQVAPNPVETAPQSTPAQAIVEQAPIVQPKRNVPAVEDSEYKPIYIDLSKEVASQNAESADSSVEKVKSVSSLSSLRYDNAGQSEATASSTSLVDWTLRLGMLSIIIAGALKLFAKPRNVEISLASPNTKTQDLNVYKSVETQKEILTKSLGLPPVKNNLHKKPNLSSLASYGMREYQNSQLPPPSMGLSMPERNINTAKNMNALRSNVSARTNTTANTPVKPRVQPTGTTRISQKQTDEAQKNFDGVKFLESMATIYQKSGRSDLASGIRQNLLRKQQAA